jgi:hypothetical protein
MLERSLLVLALSLMAGCEKTPQLHIVVTRDEAGQLLVDTVGPCMSSEAERDLVCNESIQKKCSKIGKTGEFLRAMRVHWPEGAKSPGAPRPDSNDWAWIYRCVDVSGS